MMCRSPPMSSLVKKITLCRGLSTCWPTLIWSAFLQRKMMCLLRRLPLVLDILWAFSKMVRCWLGAGMSTASWVWAIRVPETRRALFNCFRVKIIAWRTSLLDGGTRSSLPSEQCETVAGTGTLLGYIVILSRKLFQFWVSIILPMWYKIHIFSHCSIIFWQAYCLLPFCLYLICRLISGGQFIHFVLSQL